MKKLMRLLFGRHSRAATVIAGLGVLAVLWLLPPSDEDLYAGFPKVQDWPARLSSHILKNPGFSVGYSERWAGPLWVAYRARRLDEHQGVGRLDHFLVDRRTLRRISSDDFRNSGYDRGHLAPNYAMARLYGADAQRASFSMSNISPQLPRLNQLLWQRLEEAELDLIAPEQGTLWVLMGPIYSAQPQYLNGAAAVPEAYWRIWLKEQAGGPQLLAFLIPQDVCGDEAPEQFLVTVDRIEAMSGLDLFSALDDQLEARLESEIRSQDWPLQRLEGRPARYAERFGPC